MLAHGLIDLLLDRGRNVEPIQILQVLLCGLEYLLGSIRTILLFPCLGRGRAGLGLRLRLRLGRRLCIVRIFGRRVVLTSRFVRSIGTGGLSAGFCFRLLGRLIAGRRLVGLTLGRIRTGIGFRRL